MTDPDRRQQIIDGAVRVFAREGFHKASIKAIAEEADIRSPALIYHYFDNKRGLLEAVIERFAPFEGMRIAESAYAEQLFEIPPEILLRQAATRVLSLTEDRETMRLIRIYISEAARDREVAEAAGVFQRRALAFLERYLEEQVRRGRLRPHDVASAARMLVGAGLVYIIGQEIFPAVAADFPARDRYAATVIDTFLDGLRPEEQQDG